MSAQNSSFGQRLFRTRAEDVLPLKIQHQRIYILPTRRGLAFLLSLLIMLIAAVNYALSLGYALCFLLTGLFAASLLHTYKNVANINCKSIKGTDAFAGDNVQFAVEIENQSKLDRIGLMIKSSGSTHVINVQSGQTTKATLVKQSAQRGVCKLGRLTITSTYPIGLWRCWCYLHSDTHAYVYPKPEDTPPPLPALSVESDGEQNRKSNQGDIAGLQDYTPGDPLSSIAWKTAARGQGLYVKTFEDESLGGETHFDISSTGLSDLESQLSRLSAWIVQAARMNVEYSFDVGSTSLESGSGNAQQAQALIALATHRMPS